MRLRYLNLSHYPPLADLAAVFSHRAPWAAFEPQGAAAQLAIHIVIGQNGSGKSQLLRAVAASFLALADQRLPPSPVSLIYEIGRPGEPGHRTVIFDCPNETNATTLWQAEDWAFPEASDRETFEQAIAYLRTVDGAPEGTLRVFRPRIARGDYPQAVSDVLPRAILAYTSGLMTPWREAWQIPVDGEGMDLVTQDPNYDSSLERPPGWTEEDESTVVIDGGSADDENARSLVTTEAEPLPADLFRRPLLLEPVMMTAALLAVALQDAEARRRQLLENGALTNLFQKAGWHRLVGVRLRLNLDRAASAPRAMHVRLHDAILLAGECITESHPLKALRCLYFEMDAALSANGELLSAEHFNGLTTQGQALYALLGEAQDTAFERFGTLLNWLRHGVLEDIELFIRRNDKPEESASDLSDPGVLRLSEFSDGERLVLARWALFHLLSKQDDSLLLLDEPETHFNDAWKREIVQVVDNAMGDDASQVLIATHSTIVLSDVFDDEVVLIRKIDGQSAATMVSDRTFATDPSSLMMTVFHANDSIGTRAQQRIEAFIQTAAGKADPSAADVRQLQALVHRLGTGFYRTELQALLNRWQQTPDLLAIEREIPTLQSNVLKEELRILILGNQESKQGAGGGDA